MMKRPGIALAVAFAAGVAPAWAELRVEQVQKLAAEVVERPDEYEHQYGFGARLALDGDAAMVSTRSVYSYDTGSCSESYYGREALLGARIDGAWSLEHGSFDSDPEDVFWFDGTLALDGGTAVVGKPGWFKVECWYLGCYIEAHRGEVDVFSRAGGLWTRPASLSVSSEYALDWFGLSVAVDGDLLLATSPFRQSVGVYRRGDGAWAHETDVAFPASAGFDSLVALDGDTAILADMRDDEKGEDAGAAHVFIRSADGSWTREAKLLAGDGEAGALLGAAVALDGDTVLLGAPGAGGGGAAYVFVRTAEGTWEQRAKLIDTESEDGDSFGTAVTLEDEVAVIGDPGDAAAYLFTRSDGVWTQRTRMVLDDHSARFGSSVALSGRTILVGAPAGSPALPGGAVFDFLLIPDPIDLLTALVDQVRSLDLHHGTENSLIVKLDTALLILTDLSEDNDHAAANVLGGFINQVEAHHGKKIRAPEAAELVSAAAEIVDLLRERE